MKSNKYAYDLVMTAECIALTDSAAWFAEAAMVNETGWPDSITMEAHDFRLFDSPPAGQSRMALKAEEPRRFWVEHLSIYETYLRKKRHLPEQEVDRIMRSKGTRYVKTCCDAATLARTAMNKRYPSGDNQSVIALVPYFGGHIFKQSRGNAHSNISRSAKFLQLHGTMCSIVSNLPMARVVVGVCNDRDRLDVEEIFGKGGNSDAEAGASRSTPLSWLLLEVIQFKCAQGVFLAPYLLRQFQRRYRKGDWKARFVYFTEQDQLLKMNPSLGIAGLMSGVGHNTYISPNRYEAGKLKNNCGNGIRVVTSSESHRSMNNLMRCAKPQNETKEEATKLDNVPVTSGFMRCVPFGDDKNVKAYMVDVTSFRNIDLDRMRRRARSETVDTKANHPALDFVGSLHAADVPRMLLKTATPRDFYSVDLMSTSLGVNDANLDQKSLNQGTQWWEKAGSPYSCGRSVTDSTHGLAAGVHGDDRVRGAGHGGAEGARDARGAEPHAAEQALHPAGGARRRDGSVYDGGGGGGRHAFAALRGGTGAHQAGRAAPVAHLSPPARRLDAHENSSTSLSTLSWRDKLRPTDGDSLGARQPRTPEASKLKHEPQWGESKPGPVEPTGADVFHSSSLRAARASGDKRRSDVLVLMALQSNEFNDPRLSATGICSALRLFKHVAVGYCGDVVTPRDGDTNIKSIFQQRDRSHELKMSGFAWLEQSGISRRLLDAMPVNCITGSASVGPAMLKHYQKYFKQGVQSDNANAKHHSSKAALLKSIRFVVYTTSSAISLHVAAGTFPRLASALSSRTIVAAHTYAPSRKSNHSNVVEAAPESEQSRKRLPVPPASWAGSCGGRDVDFVIPLTEDSSGSTAIPTSSSLPTEVTRSDGRKSMHSALLLVPKLSSEGANAARAVDATARGADESSSTAAGIWCE